MRGTLSAAPMVPMAVDAHPGPPAVTHKAGPINNPFILLRFLFLSSLLK